MLHVITCLTKLIISYHLLTFDCESMGVEGCLTIMLNTVLHFNFWQPSNFRRKSKSCLFQGLLNLHTLWKIVPFKSCTQKRRKDKFFMFCGIWILAAMYNSANSHISKGKFSQKFGTQSKATNSTKFYCKIFVMVAFHLHLQYVIDPNAYIRFAY